MGVQHEIETSEDEITVLSIRRGSGDLTITCKKNGYHDEILIVAEYISDSYIMGMSNSIIFIGGVLESFSEKK